MTTELNQYLDDGCDILRQVSDLQESLKDLTKSVADKLDIKPALLKRALRTKYKDDVADQEESLDVVKNILSGQV